MNKSELNEKLMLFSISTCIFQKNNEKSLDIQSLELQI